MYNSRLLIAILILCYSFNGFAQTQPKIKGTIVIGQVDSLYSEILQEQREIWISLPDNMDKTKQYPVIYLLDGSIHFQVVTGMLNQLSKWQMPESIVVGIINTDRLRDFTPTNVSFSRGHKTETSGGAHNFMKFINQELKPYIESEYPTENNTTIIGHSTAGLFVLYSYLQEESPFDNYLAIEPSLWWDKENLVNETPKLLKNGNRKEKSLYIAVANSLGKSMDTVKVRKDRSEPSEQLRANLKFHDLLVKNKESLSFDWEYFENEDHGSVTIPAQYNGLRSVFSWFPFPELWRFNTPKKYSTSELVDPFYAHYKKLSTKMKREAKPDWQLVNDIGSFMLNGHNLPKKALAYFEMNLAFYPNESKSHLALGNFHLSQKDKSAAIEYYQKAIAIDGSQEAKDQLKALN